MGTRFAISVLVLSIGWCSIVDSSSLVERQDIPSVLVTIPGLGEVRGTTGQTARSNQPIAKFYNIPYAEPPTGARRFKAPVKAAAWTNVRDVSQPGRECPQPVAGLNQNNEDCLTLSVFTKNTEKSFPVMVYIHGGSFYLGSAADHPPDYLLERDVVLVVIQYRLGVFGFLSTLSNTIPGNAGMLDIIMALEWVRDHIGNFGGNPQKVTVFGQSAGAAATSGLLYSPLVSQNLFNQVILQSGGSISTWAIVPNPVENAKDIAKYAGCSESLPLEAIEQCLMTVNTETLVNALPLHLVNIYSDGMEDVVGIGMVVGGPSGFLQRKPFDSVRRGEVRRNVRMMGGVTKQDGSFLLNSFYDVLVSRNLTSDNKFMQYDLVDTVNRIAGLDEESGALTAFEIDALFSEDDLMSGNFTRMAKGLIDIAGAITLKGPVLRDIQANVKYSEMGTYLYTFDYEGEHTRFGYGQNTSHYPYEGGVHHSNENIYLFPSPVEVAKLNDPDTRMSEMMVDLWTSFAIDGVPKSDSAQQWPPVDSLIGPYLHLNSPATIGQNFYREFTVTARDVSSAARHVGIIALLLSACLMVIFH
ncbi:glutactin-like [Topomyia yanbarensis]|uniref:glutactin-like n=1 Tax=Topomyia yanbarensis TaxID=2498891 RepID=UPI00273B37EF|nr:glutactin-like [Topomyia yanbarensis]